MGLIDGLSGVIYSNLIRESRYTLFFDGLVTTLEITVFALLLGIVIGLVVALVRVMHIKVLDKIAKAYVDIIRGTPAVVQLVIIYYAILGGVNLPKVLVASVAFAINSGAYVSELIRGGILAIDKGQMEAARSLGTVSYTHLDRQNRAADAPFDGDTPDKKRTAGIGCGAGCPGKAQSIDSKSGRGPVCDALARQNAVDTNMRRRPADIGGRCA